MHVYVHVQALGQKRGKKTTKFKEEFDRTEQQDLRKWGNACINTEVDQHGTTHTQGCTDWRNPQLRKRYVAAALFIMIILH